MRKTAGEIETDVFNILKTSVLKSTIKGLVYREGIRPIDSKVEDAVISFLTGVDGEIQTGVFNLNVYVPNIDNGQNKGVLVKNVSRCLEIERICENLVESISLSGDYKFSLDSIIKSFKVDDIDQYFVNCRLKFKRSTF
jgi:hypothetical protein